MNGERRRRLQELRERIRNQPGARVVGGVFGLTFLGVGLTVISFLWGSPWDEFGSPPLVFRIFGSFVAIPFVVMGGFTAYAAITGTPMGPVDHALDTAERLADETEAHRAADDAARGEHHYQCTRCGAPLDGNADVSPHGDVKCTHCDCWFNVHG